MAVLEEIVARLEDPRYLDGLASRVTSLVQKNMTSGSWAANAPLTIANKGGSKPLVDNNELVSSMTTRIEAPAVICGTVKKQAQILHDGGEIKPIAVQYLTIPASREVRRKMLGMTPREYIEGLKASGYDVFFRVKKGAQSGAVLAVPKKKKGAEPKVIFILKKSVTIPARPFLRLPEEYLEQLRRYTANFLMGRR
jgi:phage gpG-like protein